MRREKGYGKYATYATGLFGGLHIKLRPHHQYEALSTESQNIKKVHESLPVPKSAISVRLPGIGLLITRTIEGSPSHTLVGTMSPEIILRGVSEAVCKIGQAHIPRADLSRPAWTTDSGIDANFNRVRVSKDRHKALHPDFRDLSVKELRKILDSGQDEPEKVLRMLMSLGI